MRKATGKVVSLVLALALVITSFSATFASAAKTESADVIGADGTLYLVNLNGLEDTALTDAQGDGSKSFSIDKYVASAKLETYDHIVESNDVDIYSVSVSGDSILTVKKEGDEYVATLRGDKVTGTATVNVLYTATTTQRGDEEITIRGSQKFTVVVLDRESVFLGSSAADGEAVSDLDSLQKNPQVAESGADEFATYADTEKQKPVSTATAKVYTVDNQDANTYASGDNKKSAVAVYTPVSDIFEAAEDKDYSGDAYETMEKGDYIVSASGTNAYLDINGDTITYGVANPAAGNTIRLTVSSVKEVSSGDAFATDKTLAQKTARVDTLIKGDFDEIVVGDNSIQGYVNLATKKSTLAKSKAYVAIKGGGETTRYWDVTNCDVVQDSDDATTLTIEGGRLGDVTADSSVTTVTVTDGTINALKAGSSAAVNVTGGTVSSIEGGVVTISNGVTVGDISGTTVTVSNGKVTGTITADTVNLEPVGEDDTVTVNAVKALALTVDGSLAKVSVGSYFANEESGAQEESSVTLIGDKASITSIDVDYRDTDIIFDNFVGTITAPANAKYTGFEETGATIMSNDNDTSEDATKATVNGAVEVRYLALNSGAVTFNSKVTVNEVIGNDADLIVNPGALTITDYISTANTLKFINAEDVKLEAVAFIASNDIAVPESFNNYGFEVEGKASGKYDYFRITSLDFAGLTLDCGDALEVAVGETVTVTASVYPVGTKLPDGLKIAFYLNNSDDKYLTGADLGDGRATLTGVKYSNEFSVLNEGTLSAVLVDEYEVVYEEYGEATCKVKVVEKKAPTETYKSDTTGDVVVAKGNTYQFKITSLNGQTPSVVLGSDDVFELVGTSVEGSDYFFKFQAVGASGAATGVYVNGDAKVATLYVDGNTGYTCDTTTVNVPAGGTYQVKITAASMPTLLPGNSIYTVAFASQEGNDYFFKITATSAQAGDVVGFYINGGARAFVATTV